MGEVQPYTVEMYVTQADKIPFEAWVCGLRDKMARHRILVRIDRLSLGNPGDTHDVGEGVWELRIEHGPGYRVYYARSGTTTCLILSGGDKTTQTADIRQAQVYWEEYQQRRLHEPPNQRLP